MPNRKKGHHLERWEVALVKAMLATEKYNDQDVLAHFTRPTRSINHRLISEIRSEKKHKAIKPANSDQLAEFLNYWPNVDDETGLGLRGDELLVKARWDAFPKLQSRRQPLRDRATLSQARSATGPADLCSTRRR